MFWWIFGYFFIGSVAAFYIGFEDENDQCTDHGQAGLIMLGLFFFWGALFAYIPYFLGKVAFWLKEKGWRKIEEKKLEKIYKSPNMRHRL